MAFLRRILMLALPLAVLVPQTAVGLNMQPAKIALEPRGAGATGVFSVQNNSQERVALELSMAVRQVDLDGQETNTDAEEDFLVYPPQLLLEPGEARNVRVTWIGDPNPARELAYRVICEQLPIDLEGRKGKAGGKIRLLVRYMGSVYIAPPGVEDNVVPDSVSRSVDTDGKGELVVILHNKGTAHAMLKDLTVRLWPREAAAEPASKADAVVLTGEQLRSMSGENILAGNKRRFVLPWPAALPVGPVRVEISFDRRR